MMERRRPSRRFSCRGYLGCLVGVPVATLLWGSGWAGASAPTLTMSPSTNLHDGESVSVSIGPNTVFTPNAGVNILECADPGGTLANLPKSDSTCDGNTIQGNTTLVAANGSASDAKYTIYLLPSPALGEQANNQPVCNQTDPCVLYVGQSQNDFTAPKVFSAPFTIAPASGDATTTTTAAATTTTTTTTPAAPGGGSGTSSTSPSVAAATSPSAPGGVDPSVNLASTTAGEATALASTGAPADLQWIVGLGIALLLGGSLGRRLVAGARR
jgi:hypothetical protein